VIGIANKLTEQIENIFNNWAKVSIAAPTLENLIQLAMIPNKEVILWCLVLCFKARR